MIKVLTSVFALTILLTGNQQVAAQDWWENLEQLTAQIEKCEAIKQVEVASGTGETTTTIKKHSYRLRPADEGHEDSEDKFVIQHTYTKRIERRASTGNSSSETTTVSAFPFYFGDVWSPPAIEKTDDGTFTLTFYQLVAVGFKGFSEVKKVDNGVEQPSVIDDNAFEFKILLREDDREKLEQIWKSFERATELTTYSPLTTEVSSGFAFNKLKKFSLVHNGMGMLTTQFEKTDDNHLTFSNIQGVVDGNMVRDTIYSFEFKIDPTKIDEIEIFYDEELSGWGISTYLTEEVVVQYKWKAAKSGMVGSRPDLTSDEFALMGTNLHHVRLLRNLLLCLKAALTEE